MWKRSRKRVENVLTALVELATLEASLKEWVQILYYHQQLYYFNTRRKYMDRVITLFIWVNQCMLPL